MALNLVTGGAGFIGSHVVHELARKGEVVRVLDNPSTGRTANLADVSGRIILCKTDFCNLGGISRLFADAHYVIHLRALIVTQLYKCRWQMELFFEWIKQPLRIKKFYGLSPNAVKTRIWIAISVYVLLAIVRQQLGLELNLISDVTNPEPHAVRENATFAGLFANKLSK